MGIDLNSDGVTVNDADDSDRGPNGLQNYPTILSAFNHSAGLTLDAQLTSSPNSLVDVEFFANDTVDGSQFGEGKQFLARTSVQTDSTGNARFTVNIAVAVNAGDYVTATATDAQGNTSEFARNVLVRRAELTLTLSSTLVTEQTSSVTATVTRNTPTSHDLVINLTSSDPTAATIPATVTIPAGQNSVSFEVSVVNDPIADGDQTTTINASAGGLFSASAQLAVHDDDVAVIRLTLASNSVTEKAGQVIGTVTRNTPTTNPLTVRFNASHPTAASVPISVVIPDRMTSVDFAIIVLDDAIANGNRSTTITPSADGHFSIDAALTVLDDEVAALSLSLADVKINESSGTTTGTVTRNTPTTSALSVTLTSSDSTAATVPTTVTIPAGSNSATFTVSAVNDEWVDGDQLTTVTATAIGLLSSAGQLTVADDDVATLKLALAATLISENGGSTTGTLTMNTILANDLSIALTSSDTTAATVQATVIMPAGSSSTTFAVSAVNDSIADSHQVATITATASGFASVAAQVTVTNDDAGQLSLTLQTSTIAEDNGTTTGTISLNAPATTEIVITLASGDPTALKVPKL